MKKNFKNGDSLVVEKIDSLKRYQGNAMYYYSNGDKEEYSYINNVKQGKSIFYWSNGNREERTYKKNILTGKAIWYGKNGDKEEFSYINGFKQGTAVLYGKNGSKEEFSYKDGAKQGKAILYDKDGNRKEYNYVNNLIEGFVVLYKIDGTKEETFYKNNKKSNFPLSYQYLYKDNKRINLDVYDESILYDYKKGHWDLYENSDKEKIEKQENKKVYSRNPELDIQDSGIIGIDFGTKSTVVVFRNSTNKIFPMRIGGITLNKEVESIDYENPTVIEFKNLEKFIKEYNFQKGRPYTHWSDLTVSHTAFQNLINGNHNNYIISDLKQWTASKNKSILLKDKNGKEMILPPYLELKSDDVDPIEIYAYYIGSYINNMRNGIYLEYYLSFPVTYEKEVREKILSSFEKGIKKSLPISILKNKEIMENFEVKHGSNEPAAYAICALQEYNFEPEDEEKIYYGVFDFGGGTTDFDFGIWRVAEDERSYDYELEHFGAGGDRYLGGENILMELAYETFKSNTNILRKNNITFTRPEWCEKFIGDELVIDSSQEAYSNMRFLSEKLRKYWEVSEKIEKIEKLKINLFNKSGVLKEGFEIDIDLDMIENIIKSKIENGIENFFYALKQAFKNEEYNKIYILLAGNSCKHPLVIKIFNEKIRKNKIKGEILPALGTEEAYKKLKEKNINFDVNDKTKPTGKTGVAYGILESRAGGRIKVINRDESKNISNNINFKYYVGYEARKKFKPVLTPQTEYNYYVYFLNATSKNIDLYYSSLPEAVSGKLLTENVKSKRIKLKKDYGNSKIYIKSISPNSLEYVVTTKDVLNKEFLEKGSIILD